MLIGNANVSVDDWNKFAQQVGASFRCEYHAARAWQIEHHLLHWLHRLEIFDVNGNEKRKIAQCAVGIGRHWRIFSDTLQIAHEDFDRWAEIMQVVVEYCGPGRYLYGSDWSLETSREATLLGMKDITLVGIYRTNLQIVDFRDWPEWESYYHSLSKNVRRNIAKSKATITPASITMSGGLMNALRLHAIRYSTYRRKSLSRGFTLRLVRSILRSVVLRSFYEFGVVRSDKTTLAAYGGVRFGDNTFFLEGGSAAVNHGAFWRLLVCVMERAWRDTDGRGVFVLGSDDGSQTGSKAWDGLARSRAACRAKPVAISIIRFSFQPKPQLSRYERARQ